VNENKPTLGERVIEVLAVLLLGIATVGTAWCGYQSSQWNGAQTDYARESSDERVEASRLFGLATQQIAYDANIVSQYAQAVQTGNTQLTQFYRQYLVRPAFLPLLDQWQAEIQAGGTPGSLFENQEYLTAQFADYQKAVAQSEAYTALSQEASETCEGCSACQSPCTSAISDRSVAPTSICTQVPALTCAAETAARDARVPVLQHSMAASNAST